jgi:hypothetical protein
MEVKLFIYSAVFCKFAVSLLRPMSPYCLGEGISHSKLCAILCNVNTHLCTLSTESGTVNLIFC